MIAHAFLSYLKKSFSATQLSLVLFNLRLNVITGAVHWLNLLLTVAQAARLWGEGYDSHISVSLPIKEDKLFVSSCRCAAGRENEFKRSLRLGMLGRSGGRSSGSLDDFSKGFHIR